MLRAAILFAVGLCANVLIGLPAMAQASAEVTLTRIECGTGATPTDVGQQGQILGSDMIFDIRKNLRSGQILNSLVRS